MTARHPEMPTSRAPRIVAIVAALLVTAALFDGVALLSGLDRGDARMQNAKTVVAQSEAKVVR
jgi:hypothetical protein